MIDDNRDLEHEERAIYTIIVVACVPVIVGLVVGTGVFDSGTTIAVGLAILALLGLVKLLRRTDVLPRARTVRRR